jgi:predicted dinucleotide-utilizing enzyme
MLGSGFIGRFYAESIHGQRGRDSVVAIYARREESAKSSLTTMVVTSGRRIWRK